MQPATRSSDPRARIAILVFAVAWFQGCGNAASPEEATSLGLVFVRHVGDTSEVMRVRLSDGAERRITDTAERDERWPYWSEASGRLVFQSVAADSDPSVLWLWDPNTAESERLHPGAKRDERWPVWSPDGKRLVFAFRSGRKMAGIAGVGFAGEAAWLLAASNSKDFFFRPSFSPDGARLVAQRRGTEGVGSHLWILAPRKLPTPLTEDPAFFDMKPWFTRSGEQIVYSRRRIDDKLRDIAIIAASGGLIRTLASTETSDDHSARPSPIRDEIAFSSNRAGNHRVYLASIEGGGVRALSSGTDRDAFAPRWSPDGERLVVTTIPIGATSLEANAEAHIVVLDREGRVHLDVPGMMADWMPAWP